MILFAWNEIAFWTLVIGGLGLFLYGIVSLSKILKKIAGSKLKKFFSKCSNNPIKGFLVGCGFTTVIQSSSGTTALTIGLVRAGILTFIEAAAIIIGANIGTTITSFIISIPVLEYMPIVLFLGSAILLVTTKNKWENVGQILFALGSIFFGLWIIDMNLHQLAEVPWFRQIFLSLNNQPWLGLLVGTLASTIFQSSSAVIGVLQGIYAATDPNLITLFGIIPIILGANIGTTVDAILASIGGSKDAKRLAFFHVLFNVTGALLFMGVIYICKDFLTSSSSWATFDEVTNTWNYIVDPKLQIAICHLIFNLVTAIIFLPLLKPINKLARFVIRGEDSKHGEIVIQELDTKAMKEFPATGIVIAKDQVDVMFGYVLEMFDNIKTYIKTPNKDDSDFVLELEESIDKIDRQLNEYLLLADKKGLEPNDLNLFSVVLRGCKDIERLGDYGENLINFLINANDRKIKFEGPIFDKINILNEMAIKLLKMTNETYVSQDKVEALEIIELRRECIKKSEDILNDYLENLNKYQEKDSAISYLNLVFSDMVSDYERVYSHCSNIAKLFNNDKNTKTVVEDY